MPEIVGTVSLWHFNSDKSFIHANYFPQLCYSGTCSKYLRFTVDLYEPVISVISLQNIPHIWSSKMCLCIIHGIEKPHGIICCMNMFLANLSLNFSGKSTSHNPLFVLSCSFSFQDLQLNSVQNFVGSFF